MNPNIFLNSRLDDYDSIYNNPSFNYSNKTLLSSWDESREETNAINDLILRKKRSNKLQIGRTLRIFDNFLCRTELAVDTVNILYGVNYEIRYVNEAIDKNAIFCISASPNGTSSLDIDEDCFVTASRQTPLSMRRNTFQVVSCNPDVDKTGQPVLYDEEVAIQLMSNAGKLLYLSCSTWTHNLIGYDKKLCITDKIDFYSRFKITHVDHRVQFPISLAGQTIPVNAKIVISHLGSDMRLLCDNTWIDTIFGRERNCICSKKSQNPKGYVIPKAQWLFVGKPNRDPSIVTRASLGEPVCDELLMLDDGIQDWD